MHRCYCHDRCDDDDNDDGISLDVTVSNIYFWFFSNKRYSYYVRLNRVTPHFNKIRCACAF